MTQENPEVQTNLLNSTEGYCSRCGLCCIAVDEVEAFSEFAMPDGRCKFLTQDRLCAIYTTRPELCRADVLYESHYAKRISITEYKEMLIQLCKKLQARFHG